MRKKTVGDKLRGPAPAKGHPSGERHWNATFSADDVREIRKAHAEGWSCAAIARKLGRRTQTIHQIVSRYTWKDVE